MTPNRSLGLTIQLRDLLRQDLLSVFVEEFPFQVVEEFRANSARRTRDRVFNPETTLLAMVLSATQEDRSLQHAVNLFAEVHARTARRLARTQAERRPLAKSKLRPISENTAAFSKARARLEPELIDRVFRASGDFDASADSGIAGWHGKDVYLTDGTYFQTQDTPALRTAYAVENRRGKPVSAFPQGLLQAVVRLATGAVTEVRLGSRHVSELELVWPMVAGLPPGSLLLADDLYNSYAIFALAQAGDIDVIVPGKRHRRYSVLERFAANDELVELQRTPRPAWLPKDATLPERLVLRRIAITDKVFYTTLLDPAIPAADIVAQYLRRWEIEITIREVKTLMGLAVARSKTPEMVEKEVKTALIAYNLLRQVIAKTAHQSGFPPETDLIQALFETDQTLLSDKKGRVYIRRSPGRYGGARPETTPAQGAAPPRPPVPAQDQRE
jgi:hypothetical protein